MPHNAPKLAVQIPRTWVAIGTLLVAVVVSCILTPNAVIAAACIFALAGFLAVMGFYRGPFKAAGLVADAIVLVLALLGVAEILVNRFWTGH
ncbi:MAG: hypothetical protein KF805_06390 [Phycisphaeraceae bacterium]|nr:hypothetical protein [Phycisphaeraceae bacterium]